MVYECSKCPNCPNSNFLTVILRTFTLDKQGKETVSDVKLRENLLVTPEQVDLLERIVPPQDQAREEEWQEEPSDYEPQADDEAYADDEPGAYDVEGEEAW